MEDWDLNLELPNKFLKPGFTIYSSFSELIILIVCADGTWGVDMLM